MVRTVYTILNDLCVLAEKNPALFHLNDNFFKNVLKNFETVPDSDIEKVKELLNIQDCMFSVDGPCFLILPLQSDNMLQVWCEIGRAGTERWVWIPYG